MSTYTDDDVRALARAFHGKAFFPEPGEFADGLAAKILDHLTAAGWAKRADVLAPVIGWREYDWPEGFDRRTAELIAEHAKARGQS